VFQRFIARQAILRDDLTLLGYDLRFRSDDGDDGATRGSSSAYLIVSSSMVSHWESLTGNGLAFISLGLQELLSAALILPRSKTVVEIPSTVPCNAAVVLACQSLKTADYRLALSEWRGQEELRPLAAVVDYLRVNLPSLKESDLALKLAGL
jgi:c-di-GMP phosphodiesterase